MAQGILRLAENGLSTYRTDQRMQHRDPSPFAPLPGTKPAPSALFVGRWGTLLETPEQGFAEQFDGSLVLPGAADALFRAQRAGWRVYLMGNEPAVWEGHWKEDGWKEFERGLLEHLRRAGVLVERNYACLDHPNGVPGHTADSVFRLPNTGAMYHAAHTDGVRLDHSWVIGDSTVDLVAGWRSGCRIAGVRTGAGLADGTFEVEPEILSASLADVLGEILAEQRAASA